MATQQVCTGGEEKAYVRVSTFNRWETFYSENPPIEVEPAELVTPTWGARAVGAYSTHNYGPYGRNMVTQNVWLPIQRIYPAPSTWSGRPVTSWIVVDALGTHSYLVSPQAGAATWQWGSPIRTEIRALISGIEPQMRYGLTISDAAGQERSWTSDTAPLPWEHWCGCKPGFHQCGDFPFHFCCLNCAAINGALGSAESQVEGVEAKVNTLIQTLNRLRS